MDYLRTILIFSHLMVFAFAITSLYKSDFELLFQRPSNEDIKSMGDHMLIYLVVLWTTGLGLIYIDTGFDMDKIRSAQKLITKLSSTIVLTLNAIVIHFIAFKKLERDTLSGADMLLMAIAGAISTASWTFAAFLGIAKALVKHFSLADFLGLYGLVVLGAVATTIALTPTITNNWKRPRREIQA